MNWQTSKIRDISLMECLLRVLTFLKIGPNSPPAQALKFQISEHLSEDVPEPDDLKRLAAAVKAEFVSDHQCQHEDQVSERKSECARKRGKAFVTDCHCGFCKAVNAVWLADEWGSGAVETGQPSELNDDGSPSLVQPNYLYGSRAKPEMLGDLPSLPKVGDPYPAEDDIVVLGLGPALESGEIDEESVRQLLFNEAIEEKAETDDLSEDGEPQGVIETDDSSEEE